MADTKTTTPRLSALCRDQALKTIFEKAEREGPTLLGVVADRPRTLDGGAVAPFDRVLEPVE